MAKVFLLLMLMLKLASCEKFINSINSFEDSEIRGRFKNIINDISPVFIKKELRILMIFMHTTA